MAATVVAKIQEQDLEQLVADYPWFVKGREHQFKELKKNYELARDLDLPNQMAPPRKQAYELFKLDFVEGLAATFRRNHPALRTLTPFQLPDVRHRAGFSYDAAPYVAYTRNGNVQTKHFWQFLHLDRYTEGIPTNILRVLKQARETGIPYDHEWVGVAMQQSVQLPPQRRPDPILAVSIDDWMIPIALWG